MSDKENQNKNRELDEEANANMIDGIVNNLPLPDAPVPDPKDKSRDRVKPPTEKKRCREHER